MIEQLPFLLYNFRACSASMAAHFFDHASRFCV
jgi:hypothetical protein